MLLEIDLLAGPEGNKITPIEGRAENTSNVYANLRIRGKKDNEACYLSENDYIG